MKRILTLVLTASIAASMLAGCQSKGTEGKGTSAEKPVLRQVGFQRNFDPNNDPVAKMLEEKTGYKVKYEALPIENPNDKLNLLMANKEEIDIVKLSGSQYSKLANEGALEPLDDLLKKHGQTLLKVNSQESLETAKVNGKIYGIPEKAARPFTSSAIAVRQDILDELGMKVPTTTDEFYTLLKTIKDKKNIIPLTGFESVIHEISGAFGVVTPWEVKDGKITHRLEEPGMKEYITFMNKLYNEGLIDKEWPVNNSAKVQEKFTSGKAAMMTYGWGVAPAVTTALNKNFPNSKITMFAGLKGKDGKQGTWVQATGVGWYIAIPKASKHKEDAMKYMDLKVQPELFKNLAIGEENVTYKKEADGKLFPILPKFNEERGNADWFITSTDQKAYEDLWLLRVRKDKVLYEAFEEIQKQMPYAVEDPLTKAPPLATVAKYSQKITKLENDYILKAIAGAEKLENYNKFVEQWKNEGGAESKKEANDWYATKKK
ncbi:extracellular solute-binding protein [Clostridium swellfunianum]|uniref:extracellular solute-binding protein n=1 Tax=Clostridium swellfunianum TaxID=1367462 RepID=UPI00202E0094|nr:extracellular solute-binding protein [Clostridium swellfunianum]MCM0647577.1 extracellular solute-binding protein [Clostridium swellfunianum]